MRILVFYSLIIFLVLSGCTKQPTVISELSPSSTITQTNPPPSPTTPISPSTTSPTRSVVTTKIPTETVLKPLPITVDDIPASGNWIVTKNLILENASVMLNGNLSVSSKASLTLKNVNLTMNCSNDGEYGIKINPESSIFIYDSVIASPTPLSRWHITDVDDWFTKGQSPYQPTGVTESQSPRFSFKVDRAANFEIVNSELHGCGWDDTEENSGLWLGGVKNAVIEGNTFSHNRNSLLISAMNDVVIRNNVFKDEDWQAITLTMAENITVIGNTFSSIRASVSAGGLKHSIVTENKFMGSFEAAIWLFWGCDDNIVKNNNITNWPRIGVAVAIGAHPDSVCNNNYVSNNTISGGNGIFLTHASNNRIENNRITDTQCAIMASYAAKNVINGNVISRAGWPEIGSQENGIQLFHASNNIITNNHLSLVERKYGIILHGSSQSNTIQGNSLESCAQGIGIFQSSNNNKIINNIITQNKGRSITIFASNNNVLHSNNVIDNEMSAFDNAENQWYWEKAGNYWSVEDATSKNNVGTENGSLKILPNGIDHFPVSQPLIINQVEVHEQNSIPIPSRLPDATPITSKIVWQDREITYSSNQLVIESGGSLTLDNVTLLMAEGVVAIYVYPGGSLTILNSKIAPVENGGGILFIVFNDTSLVIKNSELSGFGIWPWGGDWGGLTVFTKTAIIENTNNTGSGSGVCFGFAGDYSSVIFRNNTISDCYRAIYPDEFDLKFSSQNTIINCIQDLFDKLRNIEASDN
jgi:parallel beta-helix repeat protein